ncbi:hypothetical protein L0Y65_02400 [Candidatus Micrarchaeota archaeon]|nr:hypothetical protein [Candidatus Micrarchaeota archaeon]
MRKALILLLVLAASIQAEFLIERVDVAISDIKPDGSAKVHESIKFVMFGDYSNSVYDSGMSNTELSFWSTNTGLKDVKMHVNTGTVDIVDMRLRPQPRTKCNPIQGICHGELILDYWAEPSFKDNQTLEAESGTGLFTIVKYKPRTRRYTINPSALSFTTTPEGNIILDEDVYLTINLPDGSEVLDINPQPTGSSIQLPSHIESMTWTDIVLVKFSLIFDVEDSIDKEVSDFFGGIFLGASRLLGGPQGPAVVLLAAVVIGSFLYITMAKRRGEE